MSGLNRVMLIGRLGADPEFKVSHGGTSVLNIRLATSETWIDKDNQKQERTEWHRVTMFGRRAEALAKILQKGMLIFVEGKLQTSSYEKNGEKRYSTSVIAEDVILTGSRGDGDGGRPRGGARSGGAASDGGGGGGSWDGGGAGEPVMSDDDIPFTIAEFGSRERWWK